MSETGNKLRVFIDSNVLISAILSEQSACRQLMRAVIREHRLVLCSYTISEVSRVIKEKFPGKVAGWDYMLTSLDFELAYTPEDLSALNVPSIRDSKDLPILASALAVEPDVFVTGDKDFHTDEIKQYLVIYTPKEFLRIFHS